MANNSNLCFYFIVQKDERANPEHLSKETEYTGYPALIICSIIIYSIQYSTLPEYSPCFISGSFLIT